jgi:hypothetical protein
MRYYPGIFFEKRRRITTNLGLNFRPPDRGLNLVLPEVGRVPTRASCSVIHSADEVDVKDEEGDREKRRRG